ncbi:MAG: phosphocarrier protein HPr [Chlamydiae bacterium SM23_39]|nr:MAG: phosphocarrier protein HPr [Chlamydiae bacterium SM23_39]
MKIVKKVKVKNKFGLHIRPAAAIAKILQSKKSSVFFTYKNDTVNARSVMGILSLVIKKNSIISVSVEGVDAEITMKEVTEVLNKCFEEE